MIYQPIPFKRCKTCTMWFPNTHEFFCKGGTRISNFCKGCYSIRRGHKPRKIEVLPEGQKRCTKCQQIKAATTEQFSPKKDRKSGLNPVCRDCISVWHSNHYKKHTSKINERNKRWRDNNPDITRVIINRYRASKRKLPDNLTNEEWNNCVIYWGYRCAYCGEREGLFWYSKLCAEHYIPLGENCPGTVVENILPACFSCNASKRNSQPSKWLIKRFGERRARAIQKRIEAYFETVKNST